MRELPQVAGANRRWRCCFPMYRDSRRESAVALSTSHSRFPILLSLLLAGFTVSCVHHVQRDARPATLAQLADEFRAKAGHDRRVEGEKIQALLPRCPITWQKEINSMEALTAYDYSHPSWRLSEQELFRVLGQPNSSYGDTVRYDLVHATNHMVWKLSVDIRNDCVVGSLISGTSDR